MLIILAFFEAEIFLSMFLKFNVQNSLNVLMNNVSIM